MLQVYVVDGYAAPTLQIWLIQPIDYAGWADKIESESFNSDDGVYKLTRHEPLGVCAGIASWNATFLYVAWKIAPAVAAGNCVSSKLSKSSLLYLYLMLMFYYIQFIFKASEKAPLSVLAMARFYAEAGFPPGVVQFLSGGGTTGALLASHKQIAKISITGSIGAGVKVQEAATRSNLKKVVLELGGKSPAIVFNDADLQTALSSCTHGFLFNSGQICAAASRLYVQEDIAPDFIKAMKAEFEKASESLGKDPLDRATRLGPLADKAQLDRVMSFVEAGKQSARLLTGGTRKGGKGCFMVPTIFLEPAAHNAAYKDEIFGPVLVIRTFKTEEEAIALANNTDYGLVGKISQHYATVA